jgi:hypothetical protein
MHGGRVMLSPEDELDVLHHDLGSARRRHDSLLRARYEWRACNETELDASIRRAAWRVRELERELAVMQAEQRAADETYEETL